ncbi:hypothetical protein HS088_TW09G00478 [Tripterygium wilfordii]|uniref:Calmodulin-binding domain-containing protein n=1 Tax=Tripterygium wilfordii TaxID=458696 RepID=A0A7J7D7T5_TRIWF|nr:calmodulin binding protein PICBP-like [Tripterygium wilfordii]KAF5742430.1 hypothetical protein HS088_TW09G00478 [Tripterygium wilfordii]
MVQRKAPNKLGIQAADHVISETKWLGNLEPNSSRHRDGKSRGPDMKKKMKKSRSIKVTDAESLQSPPMRKTISQPGKPPPLNAPGTPATPQKQPVSMTTDGSPNYMKSTSSSTARKERSQVSSKTSPAASHTKNMCRRSSNGSRVSSDSGGKPVRTLARSSSLKRVRTLRKTPSFKPIRATVKKSCRVAPSTDIDVQRSTCSSTLKDSKFPAHLMLNPGGTEAEGISAMKVCPYTYCSLNGHHKSPLLPLKCFLKARRRSLKIQKNMNLKVLSPRRAKPHDDEHMILDVKTGHDAVDLSGPGPAISPVIQEVGTDFFIEVYVKNKEDEKETTKTCSPENREGTADFAGELHDQIFSLVGCDDSRAVEEDCDKEAAKRLSDGSPYSEIDFDMNQEKYGDIVPLGMDTVKYFPEETNVDNTTNKFSGATTGICNENDFIQECDAANEEDESNSGITEMEWEEGQYSILELVTEANHAVQIYDEAAANVQTGSEVKHHDFHEDPVMRSGHTVGNSSEDMQAEEIPQDLFEEQSTSFDMQSDYSDYESDGVLQNWENLEFDGGCNGMVQEVSPTEEACEGTTIMEEEEEEVETDLIDTMVNSIEEPIMEPIIETAEVLENGIPGTEDEILDSSCITKVTTEGSYEHHENETSQDNDGITCLQNQTFNSSENCNKIDPNVKNSMPNSQQEVPRIEDKEQTAGSKSLVDTEISSHGSLEADQDKLEKEKNQNQELVESRRLDDIAEVCILIQDTVDASLETKSDGQHKISDPDITVPLEEDQGEAQTKNSSSVQYNEQSKSGMKASLAENSIGRVDKLVEESTNLTMAEIQITANSITSAKSGSTFRYIRSNHSQNQPNTCSSEKWTIRCKGHIEDTEEQKKFNPREPNFLPEVPEPEGEKVDLRHQMMDDRRNAEDYLLDYALQQAVTKLAPARKKKVALLVEAFETVKPVAKWETPMRRAPAGFAHTRSIQACS